MDKNEDGQPTRQRWFISEPAVTVDFLIEPDDNAEAQAGRLFPLTRDWAAIIAPGLHLAFSNNQIVTMDGRTIVGETARRDVRVCGAGAFVVLKALAYPYSRREQGCLRLVLSAAELRRRRFGCGRRVASVASGRERGESTGILAG